MKRKNGVIVLAATIIFLLLARDFILKNLITAVAGSVTGAPTHIGSFSLSLIKQSVNLSDFKMYSPKGFPKDILVDITRLGASCNLGALLKGKLHLRQIDIALKELTLSKNKAGRLNVDALKIVEESKKSPAKKWPKKPAKEIAIQIDQVNLNIGRIVNKDYSVEGPPLIKVYDINLNKTYKNINSAQQLAALIVAEPLKAAGIQGAKIYGAMLLTTVSALPVAAAFAFTGKDFAEANLSYPWNRVYDSGLKHLQKTGKIKREDRLKGTIHAVASGASIILKLSKIIDTKTHIVISARKLGLPQPAIAAGILYQITAELKIKYRPQEVSGTFPKVPD